MVSFADSPFKFLWLPPSRFLDHLLVLACGIMKLLHPVLPKERVAAEQRALVVFPARNRAFETSLWDNLWMRALLSQQEEPSLYQSTGNYFSHVLRSNLPTPEKRPKVHFALFLKTRISTNEATFPVRLQWVFFLFGWNLARMLPDNVAKKPCQGIFIFYLLWK